MGLLAALRVGADLGDETSFIEETAELSPDQLSIAIAKPMVRRARVDPGQCLCGLVFSWGFHASQHRIRLVPCFRVLDLKLQLCRWFDATLK